jgi:pimeloyl-ACP methyl ester carboxylesterase
MRPKNLALIAVLCLAASIFSAGGCSTMDHAEIGRRLLAIEKNAPLRGAVQEREVECVLDGRRVRGTHRWTRFGDPNGPTVVLVHGTPSSMATWTEVVHGSGGRPGLAATCDVWTPEIVGHGTCPTAIETCTFQACADWVSSFLDMHDLRGATLVGQSYGGEFAWRCALDRPERVARLVLMSSAGLPRRAGEWLPEEVKMREWGFLAHLGWLLNSPERVAPALQLHFQHPLPAWRVEEVYLSVANRRNWSAMVDLARDEEGHRASELSSIAQPTLLMWGEDDVAYRPERFATGFRDAISGSTLLMVPASGHYPQEEAPQFVVEALSAFAHGRPLPEGASQQGLTGKGR